MIDDLHLYRFLAAVSILAAVLAAVRGQPEGCVVAGALGVVALRFAADISAGDRELAERARLLVGCRRLLAEGDDRD